MQASITEAEIAGVNEDYLAKHNKHISQLHKMPHLQRTQSIIAVANASDDSKVQ